MLKLQIVFLIFYFKDNYTDKVISLQTGPCLLAGKDTVKRVAQRYGLLFSTSPFPVAQVDLLKGVFLFFLLPSLFPFCLPLLQN